MVCGSRNHIPEVRFEDELCRIKESEVIPENGNLLSEFIFVGQNVWWVCEIVDYQSFGYQCYHTIIGLPIAIEERSVNSISITRRGSDLTFQLSFSWAVVE